jgi:hypothetical protein
MPQTINTNVPSLTAQRNLNNSQSMLSVSLQRLSSGLRINSAKDDAAGLAIQSVSVRKFAASTRLAEMPMTVFRWRKRLKVLSSPPAISCSVFASWPYSQPMRQTFK